MSSSTNQDSGYWRVKLFGSPEVTTPSGNAIRVTSRKPGELLAYLALNLGRAHSREKLVDLIWGDSEVGDARTRLRQEILKLRSLLATEPSIASPLIVTNDACQLRDGTEVDAVVFQSACSEASRSTDLDLKRGLYLAAVRLYSSDLLPGFDAAWIAGERARLSQCYSMAILDLADTQRRLKDYGGAEESLNTFLRHEPLSEECHIALMRLYSELGRPTQVRQQLEAMERTLREGLDVAPTVGSLKLAEELREAAGKQASELSAIRLVESSTDQVEASPNTFRIGAPHPIQELEPHKSLPFFGKSGPRHSFRLLLGMLILAIAFTSTLFHLKAAHSVRVNLTPTRNLVVFNKQKWTYIYQPRPGEKPDSEGRAILADPTTIWVTGFIQTEKDDTDILTLKLDGNGKLLWVDRYSSQEHDCDRAFSIAHDGKGGIFVAGETYVPSGFRDREGWRLVLLHYDKKGHRCWVRRSPMITRNESECVQVESDTHGGCFIAGTALDNGKQSALVLRYDAAGNPLWNKTVSVGTRTVFSRLTVDSGGDVFLCGTLRTVSREGYASEAWLTARLSAAGSVKWVQTEDGPQHSGTNSASRLMIDRGGNVVVAGVFRANAETPDKQQGIRLAVQKYSPDGVRLWQQVISESGPTVVVDGLSVSMAGDVIVGGTERRFDGNWEISLARFDSFGNMLRFCRCPNPPGYTSSALKGICIEDSDQAILFSEVSKSTGDDMRLRNAIAETQRSPAGEVLHNWLYEPAPDSSNYLRDFSVFPYLAVTGQTGPTVGPKELMVINY